MSNTVGNPKQKLVKAAKKAGDCLKHEDIPGWEAGESTAEWVHTSRLSKDCVFATARAIRQDSKDAEPQEEVLADVTVAVDAVRRKS